MEISIIFTVLITTKTKIMKKYIVIIQTSANDFKALVLKANSKNDLYPMYRGMGMAVSTQDYSQHNMNMAKMQVEQYNGLNR